VPLLSNPHNCASFDFSGRGVWALRRGFAEAEALRLDAKYSKSEGGAEIIQRIHFCIRQTFGMITKREGEIHPARMAPEEVKNVFPNMAEMLALRLTQKLFKEHPDASDSSDLS
jgi:hypothetical protein